MHGYKLLISLINFELHEKGKLKLIATFNFTAVSNKVYHFLTYIAIASRLATYVKIISTLATVKLCIYTIYTETKMPLK